MWEVPASAGSFDEEAVTALTTPRPSRRMEGMNTKIMEGLSVLILEDEFLLACSLEEHLRSLGSLVVGPFSTLAAATEASRRESFDVAILDINVNREMVYPLADELLGRKMPFVFLTGYGSMSLPERFRDLPHVAKPYETNRLIAEIERAIQKSR
jgi:DNA-binding NtrC family response regulator